MRLRQSQDTHTQIMISIQRLTFLNDKTFTNVKIGRGLDVRIAITHKPSPACNKVIGGCKAGIKVLLRDEPDSCHQLVGQSVEAVRERGQSGTLSAKCRPFANERSLALSLTLSFCCVEKCTYAFIRGWIGCRLG